VQAVYSRRADVVNRGLSGFNTKWTLELFDSISPGPSDNVELVTVFFGANDATVNPPQHVGLADFSNNMHKIVELLTDKWKAKRIVLIGPPPIAHDLYTKFRLNRTDNGGKTVDQVLDRTYLQGTVVWGIF
jgi:lysophospholipase L1-like esterase